MKTPAAALLLALCFAAPAYAQEVKIAPNDTVQSLLAGQKTKRVTVLVMLESVEAVLIRTKQ